MVVFVFPSGLYLLICVVLRPTAMSPNNPFKVPPTTGKASIQSSKMHQCQVDILLTVVHIHFPFFSKSLTACLPKRGRGIGSSFFASAKLLTSHQRKVRKRCHSRDKTYRNWVKRIHVTGTILQTGIGPVILILVSDLVKHRSFRWQVSSYVETT